MVVRSLVGFVTGRLIIQVFVSTQPSSVLRTDELKGFQLITYCEGVVSFDVLTNNIIRFGTL